MPDASGPTPRDRLAAALRALDARVSWTQVRVGVDERPGWVRCADFVGQPDRLHRWQQQTADSFDSGSVDPTLTAAGLVLDWYLAAVVLPGVGVFHLDRIVPDLDPSALALRPGPPGSPVAATAVLTDQPVVVDAGPAGPQLLRAQLQAHAESFLATYAPLTRFGRRTCWAAVTDAVDTAFLTAGWVSGEPDRAAEEAVAVLGDRDEAWVPGAGGSTLHQVTDRRGRRHWTRRRHGCCFLYRLPHTAACLTCPRVSDAERVASAAGWD